MADSLFKVAVVGAGPIGSTIAAHLIEAGAHVVVCDISSRRVDNIMRNGIILKNTISKSVPVQHTAYSIGELASHELDLVIYSVKCPFLKPALKETKKIDSGRPFFMSAQNGIGTEVDIATVFSAHRALRMVINFAGNLVHTASGEDEVNVTFFNPPNYLSALTEKGKETEQIFVLHLNRVGLITESSENIQVHIWEKAILNAALSALCTIVGHTMGAVMSSEPMIQLVKETLTEAMRVATAQGIDLGPDFVHLGMGYLKKGGMHKPSMLVDVENRLPTEIDYLNGKIAAYGQQHGIETPLNTTLTAMVKFLESNYGE